jgi:hypothetical protein
MNNFDFLERAARFSTLARSCDDPLIARLLEELAETYTAEAQAAGGDDCEDRKAQTSGEPDC